MFFLKSSAYYTNQESEFNLKIQTAMLLLLNTHMVLTQPQQFNYLKLNVLNVM